MAKCETKKKVEEEEDSNENSKWVYINEQR